MELAPNDFDIAFTAAGYLRYFTKWYYFDSTEFLSERKHNHFNVQVLIIFKYCFVCREIGDYERAESCYKKAVKLKPQVGHI